ncbi:NAD(P)/FAD-dependent oxidoreductase [Maricurvus nonylphenolicus]|uniref:NAD(P)/FAD-dependent oxidoreductase n=1 Tax=Maricurvus nonylphenolicus TaxID=1008307 RepID=UPI0036F2C769
MSNYDAIIVGARVGGAPLAMLLARAGHKVLLVDRAEFGSDTMSTHFIKRTGASRLERWGLIPELEKIGTPAIREMNFYLGDNIHLKGEAPPHDGMGTDWTPRRFYLDKILVNAAIEAGAEAREKFTVKELLFEDGRVVGIRGTDATGKEYIDKAKVVVGADGVNSMVAKSVNAQMYIDAGIHTCGYYAYYSGMRDRDDAGELYMPEDERRFYITFPTNDNLDLVFLFWPTEMQKIVRSNTEKAFAECLKLVPKLEARVNSGQRETRFTGTPLFYNYFRRAHGPGWALVGDSALHRDPIGAQGITNAFAHADLLAEELIMALDGKKEIDHALADYDRRQFELLKMMFDYNVDLAMLKPMSAEDKAMMAALAADPEAAAMFFGVFIGSTPFQDAFPPEKLREFAESTEKGKQIAAQAMRKMEEGVLA